jgi:hypothetical protein
MLSQRQRAVMWAAVGLVAIWALAFAGYTISKNLKMTTEKVHNYVNDVDLNKLTGAARAKALQELADKINKLSLEERQRMRAGRMAERWFEQMTEEERGAFIEATMPTGFKQMLAAFEEQPEEKRRRAIAEALKRLRESNSRLSSGQDALGSGTNGPPISAELQAKVRTMGLKAFYSQSSAQTKAELAPVLEELQKVMESGRFQRGR